MAYADGGHRRIEAAGGSATDSGIRGAGGAPHFGELALLLREP